MASGVRAAEITAVVKMQDETEAGLKSAQQHISGFQRFMHNVAEETTSLLGADLFKHMIAGVKDMAGQAVGASLRYHELDTVLGVVGKTAGISSDSINKQVRGIASMGIQGDVARETLLRLIQAHIDTARATDLARTAQDAAVISGQNSSDTLDQIIQGIVTLQPEMLRTAGLYVSLDQEESKWAAEHHRTVASLTTVEKQQIALNAALAAGKNIAGAYTSAMEEPGKVLRSFPRLISDLSANLGNALYPAIQTVVVGFYEWSKGIVAATGPGTVFATVVGQVGAVVGSLAKGAFTALGSAFASIGDGLGAAINMFLKTKDAGLAASVGIFTFAQALGVPLPIASQLSGLAYDLVTIIGNLVSTAIAFGEAFGRTVLPALERVGRALVDAILPALTAVGLQFSGAKASAGDFEGALSGVAAVLDATVPVIQVLGGVLQALAPYTQAIAFSLAFLVGYWAAWNTAMLVTRAIGIVTFIVQLVTQMAIAALGTEGLAGAWAVLDTVMAANPIGIVVVALALLVGALIFAYTHSERFRAIVDTIGGTLLRWAQEALAQYSAAAAEIGATWARITVMAGGYRAQFEGFIAGVGAFFAELRDGWNQIVAGGAGVLAWFGSLPSRISGLLGAALAPVLGFVQDVISAFATWANWSQDLVPQTFGQIPQALADIFGLAKDVIVGALTRAFQDTVGLLRDQLQVVATVILVAGAIVLGAFLTLFSAVLDYVGPPLRELGGLVLTTVTGIASAVTAFLGPPLAAAAAVVSGLLAAIGGWFLSTFGPLPALVNTTLGSVGNFVSTHLTAALNVVTSVLSAVSAAFTSALNYVLNLAGSLLAQLLGVYQNFLGLIGAAVQFWLNYARQVALTALSLLRDDATSILNFLSAWVIGPLSSIANSVNYWFNRAKDIGVSVITSLRDQVAGLLNGLAGIGSSAASNLADAVKGGLNSVIGVLQGFIDRARDFLGHFGVHTLDKITIPRFASGGVLPVGAGMVTDGPMAIVGEGNPAYPEVVIPSDPLHRPNALKLFLKTAELLGVEGMQGGGILSWLPSAGAMVQGPLGGFTHAAILARTGGRAYDYVASMGSPLYAGVSGTSSQYSSGYGGGYGNSIWFSMDQGGSVILAHLMDIVRTGHVNAGTLIGHTDNTGFSTGPHLHFELRNSSFDPGGGGSGVGGFSLKGLFDGVMSAARNAIGGAIGSGLWRDVAFGAFDMAGNAVKNSLPFDNGGIWPPGTLGVNSSTTPEFVFTGGQLAQGGERTVAALERLERAVEKGNQLLAEINGSPTTAAPAAGRRYA